MNKIIKFTLLVAAVVLMSGCSFSNIASTGQTKQEQTQTQKNIKKDELNLSNGQNKINTDTVCVNLGESGPNASMGPSDPNINKKCCNGLVLTSPIRCAKISKINNSCTSMEGCGTVCVACGDNVCDPKYENKCNCKNDCK